ncbi:MAG: hypothetical protein A2275_10895 [Bacteroidetes bacterium RIFOXYA12_FULL_35_11]|nr:MAG: hypothetical protein A2X01_08515 [Bacteroidetes bacterium GWF2_35_48]OFY74581.1 MAG: hypothetical protein A2275_10895 [Bacteroidetes bacterium RIFOXYA12_FULL_35_11]OFY92434.1 MAG: hypothetical protein A2309_12560 [Bacteroidetes bacterium RIFOXYB2_FULL_35_7]OFY95990.1 MAG: hypothetical protein A2491_07370 [Bacteroidetes bacterium RIFOXYC12_FULL_35_7]
MKIQYCSDLHLEFPDNYDYLKKHPLKPIGDILVIAGDFYLLSNHTAAIKDFISYASDNFQEVYWLPGNHEYYHSDISKYPSSFLEKINSNFFLINNKVVSKENADIIFSTLWSEIPLHDQWYISKHVSDFLVIKNKKKKFSPDDFNKLHTECLNFIKAQASLKNEKQKVVVTHHVPTKKNYPDEYRGSKLNTAFCTELHDFIETSEIDSWIFGHHHTNVEEFKIGKTKLLTNQLGYVHYGEHREFRLDAVLTLDI